MTKLIKANEEICSKCIYRSGETSLGCNYIGSTGHSRIFKNGEMAYPKDCCDKFKEGDITRETIFGWSKAVPGGSVRHGYLYPYRRPDCLGWDPWSDVK